MFRALCTLVLLASSVALAADQGNISVIQDVSGVIHTPGGPLDAMQVHFCRETAKQFYLSHPDQFDGLITFSTKTLNDFDNVQQGTPVKQDEGGIGRTPFNWTSQYGSAGKLSQCVFMGSLPKLPGSPDSYVAGPFGLPFGLTGVELVAHEYGHHWLLSVNYDKGDGSGPHDLLRGYESDSPNNHYSSYADSHSVMYGSFVTDNGNGSYTLNGGDRKYSELDQYLMGLRGPSEVSPMLVINDGSDHGSPAVAQQKGSTTTMSGTRVDVSIDDIIRANGPRTPDVSSSQKCWRVAFVLVSEGTTPPTASDVAKLDSYRQRFSNWFTWATDGRGTMDTTLAGTGCGTNHTGSGEDAGTVTPQDAGTQQQQDAGNGPNETPDAGENTSIQPEDNTPPGETVDTATTQGGGYNHDNISKLHPAGCGCSSLPGAELAAGMLALAMLRRRRRAR